MVLCENMKNAIACLILSSFFFGSTIAQRPTVTLNDGIYIGTTLSVPSATTIVDAFYSIPYAAKPERFSPAQPRAKGSEKHDAISAPPQCIQQPQQSE
jgi:hypothetical protein